MKRKQIITSLVALSLLSVSACDASYEAQVTADVLFESASETTAEETSEQTTEAAQETSEETTEETEPVFDTSIDGNFILSNDSGIDIDAIYVISPDEEVTDDSVDILNGDRLPDGSSAEISYQGDGSDEYSICIVIGEETMTVRYFPIDSFATAGIECSDDDIIYIEYTDPDGNEADTLEDETAYIESLTPTVVYSYSDSGNDADQGCVGDDALFY